METATPHLTVTTGRNWLESKIIGPLGEKVRAVLELMIVRSLRRWMFRSVENRPYSVSGDQEEEGWKGLQAEGRLEEGCSQDRKEEAPGEAGVAVLEAV